MHISNLPAELLFILIDLLDVEDLRALSATCQYFRSICAPICIHRWGLDKTDRRIDFPEVYFGLPLYVLANASVIRGDTAYYSIHCNLPGPPSKFAKVSVDRVVDQLNTYARMLRKPKAISGLGFQFSIPIEPPKHKAADSINLYPPNALQLSDVDPECLAKWLEAFTDLLRVAAQSCVIIHLSMPGYKLDLSNHTRFPLPWLEAQRSISWSRVETLSFHLPGEVLYLPFLALQNLSSVNEVRLDDRYGSCLTPIDYIHFPNLQYCFISHYPAISPRPTEALYSFLCRHKKLHFLTLLTSPTSSEIPIGDGPHCGEPMVPDLNRLDTEIELATWFFQNPYALPSLRDLIITNRTVSSTTSAQLFWDTLASCRVSKELDCFTIQGTPTIRCLLGLGDRPPPRFNERHAFRRVKTLTLTRYIGDFASIPSILLHGLPRQIPRIFPCLQTLEITEATLDFSGESKETFLDALGGVWSTLKVGASVVEYVMPKPVLTSWKNIPTDIPVLSLVTQETETAPGCTASCAIQ